MKNKIFGILILITSVLFFIYSSLVAIMAINILYTTDVNTREGDYYCYFINCSYNNNLYGYNYYRN